mmetsp:Transcript_130190/g.417823  ORF Transcript_130190/g.417823 Transcript_130190/m.417823 type:complete len:253 (+) Transcript_130190:543-1301(+)
MRRRIHGRWLRVQPSDELRGVFADPSLVRQRRASVGGLACHVLGQQQGRCRLSGHLQVEPRLPHGRRCAAPQDELERPNADQQPVAGVQPQARGVAGWRGPRDRLPRPESRRLRHSPRRRPEPQRKGRGRQTFEALRDQPSEDLRATSGAIHGLVALDWLACSCALRGTHDRGLGQPSARRCDVWQRGGSECAHGWQLARDGRKAPLRHGSRGASLCSDAVARQFRRRVPTRRERCQRSSCRGVLHVRPGPG